MRVIAGSAKHMTLKTIDSYDTRPTTDRIKETLFNMLQFDLPGCGFMDLFAGSGAIGIEALSRGAAYAVFVESNPAAVKVIRENLQRTHLEEKAEIVGTEIGLALNRMRQENRKFDFVFMDPPYGKGLEFKALEVLKTLSCIHEDTIFIVEAEKNQDMSEAERLGYEIKREKIYKTNKHIFLKRKGQAVQA